MEYIEAIFVEKKNRFIGVISLNDRLHLAHIPNTGRLKELLFPGNRVLVSYHEGGQRKTNYSIRFALKEDNWVSIDSQLINQVLKTSLLAGQLSSLLPFDTLKTEVKRGDSRLDFMLIHQEREHYIEAKGVTLGCGDVALFPDAPTTRGIRHLEELISLRKEGYQASVCFVITVPGAKAFRPNPADEPFREKLREAEAAGVMIFPLLFRVTPDTVKFLRLVPHVI